MTPAAIVTAMRKAGVVAEVRGSALHLRAPPGVLRPDLTAAIAEHKAEVIAFLRLEAGEPAPTDFSIWQAIYAEVETWGDALQQAHALRTQALVNSGLPWDRAEFQAFLDLLDLADAPSPSIGLGERFRLTPQAVESLSRRAIGRPAPSTTDEDARLAVQILDLHGRSTR